MKTYIIGHRKPDADSVISAIALSELINATQKIQSVAVITEKANPETTFIFTKFQQQLPQILSKNNINPDDQFVLVDHNEEDQRLENLNPEQIIRIVDHHKLNLSLDHPIDVLVKTWGSTATIIWSLFHQHQIAIKPQLATLILCAVLSDTVGLRSATTTQTDKDAVKDLSQTAGISDIDALTLEIFKAKSNLSQLTPEQIVKNDYKIFDFSKKTFIGQVETVEQQQVIKEKKQDLLQALQQVKTELGVELAFLAISDVLSVNTKILLAGPEEAKIAQTAFDLQPQNDLIDIGAKLSRKKQIAPPIEKALNQ